MDERTSKRILMVEDEESILLAVSDYLTHLGYQVDCAREIDAARRLLNEHDYAAVISDVRLSASGANEGLQIATEVKQGESGAEVILLTAYGSEEVERKAREQGVAAFLHKPKPLRELAQIIYSILSNPQETAGHHDLPAPTKASQRLPARASAIADRFNLTREELDVARLVGEGRSNQQIADILQLSEAEVAEHRETLAVRLDPRSRFELALYLVRSSEETE
jgi:two-component system, NtrC family, response regulator PilR